VKAEIRLMVDLDEASEEEIYHELIRFFLDREGCPEIHCSYNHLNERIEILGKVNDENHVRSYDMDMEYIRDSARRAIETSKMLKKKDDTGKP
jgi:hypothetical protein